MLQKVLKCNKTELCNMQLKIKITLVGCENNLDNIKSKGKYVWNVINIKNYFFFLNGIDIIRWLRIKVIY